MYYMGLACFSNSRRRRFLKNAFLKANKQSPVVDGYATAMAKARGKTAPTLKGTKSELLKDAMSDPYLIDPLDAALLESASRRTVTNTLKDGLEDKVVASAPYSRDYKNILSTTKKAKNRWIIATPNERTKNTVTSLDKIPYKALEKIKYGYRSYDIHTHPTPYSPHASTTDIANAGKKFRNSNEIRQEYPDSGVKRYINTPSADGKSYVQSSHNFIESTEKVDEDFINRLKKEQSKLIKRYNAGRIPRSSINRKSTDPNTIIRNLKAINNEASNPYSVRYPTIKDNVKLGHSPNPIPLKQETIKQPAATLTPPSPLVMTPANRKRLEELRKKRQQK